jgi:hypothetical protein
MPMRNSVELEAELKEARAAEKEAEAERRRQAKEYEQALAAKRREAADVAKAVADKVNEAIAWCEVNWPTPTRMQRYASRAFLHHLTPPPELMNAVDVVARSEEGLGVLWDACEHARQRCDFFCDVLVADLPLPEGDEVLAPLHEAEVRAWRALVERAKVIAGEN